MNKLMNKLLMITAMALVLSPIVSEAKEGRIGKRVRQGVKSGQMTKEERGQVNDMRKQNHEEIKAKREELKADGGLSKEDRNTLKKMKRENHQEVSKKVYEVKHNDVVREGTVPAAPAVPAQPAMPEVKAPEIPSISGQ